MSLGKKRRQQERAAELRREIARLENKGPSQLLTPRLNRLNEELRSLRHA